MELTEHSKIASSKNYIAYALYEIWANALPKLYKVSGKLFFERAILYY
jgi:hypothetical protein